MNAKTALLLLLIVLSITFISGCLQQEPKSTQGEDKSAQGEASPVQEEAEPVCGNGIVESGEECDGKVCAGGELCTEECKCETLAPPALPE